MRILILLQGKLKQNSYAEFLYHSLLSLFAGLNYAVEKAGTFSEAKKANGSRENAAIILQVQNKNLSLFDKLKLRSILKKQKIEKLVHVAGSKALSLPVPQLIIADDYEKWIVKNKLSSVATLAVCSHVAKQKLMAAYSVSANYIQVFPVFADALFQPVSWSEQQAIKMQHTQGREYFLVSAEHQTYSAFMCLLKAFSAFKKWQHSSMKLVVVGNVSFSNHEEWSEKINTYKYREDIVLSGKISQPEFISVLGSAYVFIHTPVQDDDVMLMLQAMQCGAPCIAFTTKSMEEYAGNAVIMIEPDDYKRLGEKMILLYKDEALRSRLIADGIAKAKQSANEKKRQDLIGFITKRINA